MQDYEEFIRNILVARGMWIFSCLSAINSTFFCSCSILSAQCENVSEEAGEPMKRIC